MIDLTGLPLLPFTPMPLEFGGLQEPALGGPSQWIDRVGGRWAIRFATPPIDLGNTGAADSAGRFWTGMLTQARREGGRIAVPQPQLPSASPGSPVVASNTASGRFVPVSGLTPGYQVQRGQWLSFRRGTRRYFDMNMNDVVAAGDGTATLLIANLIRKPLVAGDVIDLAEPKIEGWVMDFEQWTVELDGTVAFAFTIREKA